MGDTQRETSSGHAHVYRIRLDAEGTSAAEIETTFNRLTVALERGLSLPMNVVGQVIEMSQNAPKRSTNVPHDARSPYVGSWYKGRLVLAPDLGAQGCDEYRGDLFDHRLADQDDSTPAALAEK